jgi:lysophospholipase L1-like esterase
VLVVLAVWPAGACQSSEAPVPPGEDRTIDYVALGDSYTAAPLVPSTDTSDSCLRSDGNYPHLLAAELPGVRLTDVSCSGADSAAISRPQQAGGQRKPPQLHAVSGDTDLVTIGIGGNDFGLFGSMALGCLRLAEADADGAPCRDAHRSSGGDDDLLARVPRIRAKVADVIASVRARAPEATVVVVDYPRILPASGTCPDRVPLAAGDYAYVGAVNRALSAAVRAAAAAAGVASVDVYAASRGHDVCSDQPWVNGISTDPGRALALHPFAVEQRAVAELILELL